MQITLTKREMGALLLAAEFGFGKTKRRLEPIDLAALERALIKLAVPLGREPRMGKGTPLRGSAATEAARRARKQTADDFAANVLPVIKTIKASGITSYNGIAGELNRRGIKTARGGKWAPKTVRAMIQRAAGNS